MPSTLSTARGVRLAAALLPACAAWLALISCTQQRSDLDRTPAVRMAADAPAVCLGNVRAGRPLSSGELKLSEFLFGAAPEGPTPLIKPVAVRAAGPSLWVADSGHMAVLRQAAPAGAWSSVAGLDQVAFPTVLAVDGDRLFVGDAAGGAVIGRSAAHVQRYSLAAEQPLQPTGVLVVDDELWVANAALHRLEVFDLADGRHLRSIGRRGRGDGEFTMPVGLARAADGQVLAVDSLGRRVHVFSASGAWQRQIGAPGLTPGTFGRPKDVAVGPDGTIFVPDATARCVHAFAPDGRFLAAFGAEGGPDALALPIGVSIMRTAPSADRTPPGGFAPLYYVLVAEQVARPGIRAFAWRGPAAPVAVPAPRRESTFTARVENPHWQPAGCKTCHTTPTPARIAPAEADALCLRCHDGVNAAAESHPVGWPADGQRTRAPAGWPLTDGKLGCLTCHDVARHCRADAPRPAANAALVRDLDPRRPLEFCTQCHVAENWRVNPHRLETTPAAAGLESCRFCHTQTPPKPASGQRSGDADLHQPTTELCLNCHVRHADPAVRGHLGRPLDGPYHARVDLPLEAGLMTCATCHNPHTPGLFTSGSPLETHASSPDDAADYLRADYDALCTACHAK